MSLRILRGALFIVCASGAICSGLQGAAADDFAITNAPGSYSNALGCTQTSSGTVCGGGGGGSSSSRGRALDPDHVTPLGSVILGPISIALSPFCAFSPDPAGCLGRVWASLPPAAIARAIRGSPSPSSDNSPSNPTYNPGSAYSYSPPAVSNSESPWEANWRQFNSAHQALGQLETAAYEGTTATAAVRGGAAPETAHELAKPCFDVRCQPSPVSIPRQAIDGGPVQPGHRGPSESGNVRYFLSQYSHLSPSNQALYWRRMTPEDQRAVVKFVQEHPNDRKMQGLRKILYKLDGPGPGRNIQSAAASQEQRPGNFYEKELQGLSSSLPPSLSNP